MAVLLLPGWVAVGEELNSSAEAKKKKKTKANQTNQTAVGLICNRSERCIFFKLLKD